MEKAQELLVDKGLIAASQAGDMSALSKLYDRHVIHLYRFIYRHVNHPQDAEDLTSEVMLRMVNNLASYKERSTFKSWLYGIARNAIADLWRTRYKIREELVADFSGIGASTLEAGETGSDDGSDDPRIAKATSVFERLSEPHRAVLTHRFIEQHTVAETAEAMKTSAGNVKVLQHRALKKAAEIAKEII